MEDKIYNLGSTLAVTNPTPDGIPFTQYVLPHGKRCQVVFTGGSPADVANAKTFMDAGGKFEIEILTTGQVSATANFPDPEEGDCDVAIEISRNDESIIPALSRLFAHAVAFLANESDLESE